MNNDRKQTDDNVGKKQEFLRYTFCLNLQTTKVFSFSIQRQLRSFQKSTIRFIVILFILFYFWWTQIKSWEWDRSKDFHYFICVVDKSSLNLVQKVTINFIISSELLESLLTKMNGWILFGIFWQERKTFSWNWRLLKQCLKVLWRVENWKVEIFSWNLLRW